MTNHQSLSLCGADCPAQFHFSETDFPGLAPTADWSIRKTTLQSGTSTGVEVLEVSNGLMTVFILPTRGMGIWKIEAGKLRIGWDAPTKLPVHPMFVNMQSRNRLGWLDGFNELLCRCGLAFNGPPGLDEDAASPIESEITLHGRIANIPAESVTAEITQQGLCIRGVTREVTLFGPNLQLETEYLLPWGQTELSVTDRVTNLASKPAEMQLLYHINVGEPLLEAGSSWQAPLQAVYPRDPRAAEGFAELHEYLGPTADYAEQVYLCQLIPDEQQISTALLKNAAATQGFAVSFEMTTLPCFSLWKNTQPKADGYCTGLEPATNFPNFKAVERKNGRVVQIPSGGEWTGKIWLSVLSTASQVNEVQSRISSLQQQIIPHTYPDQQGLTEF